MPLTDNEVRIVTLIDQRFWETGHLATNEKLAQDLKLSEQTIKNAWKKPEFRQALVARGINLSKDADGILLPEQIMVANLLCNTLDKRSVREKLDWVSENSPFSISTQQYNAWMRQPAFANYLKKRAESAFAHADAAAYQNFVKLIEQGDFNSIKLFFEMRNIYNPRVQIDVNIEQVVVRLVEIVAKHVTDPTALQAIAEEVAQIELGPGSGGGVVNNGVDSGILDAVSI